MPKWQVNKQQTVDFSASEFEEKRDSHSWQEDYDAQYQTEISCQ